MAPRPIRPKNEKITSKVDDKVLEQQQSKRKAVSSACIPCRKRKSKCDGGMPACSTCTAVYRTECVYDESSDHRRKNALKQDIQSLQHQYDALDVIVTSLRRLPEGESISLLHSLRSEVNVDTLANSLKTDVNLPRNFGYQTLEAEFAEQLSPMLSSSRGGITGLSVSREDSADEFESHSGEFSSAATQNVWLRIPHDVEFVDDLLHQYFYWIHPISRLLSKDIFLRDMNQGRNQFCSSILVNALLSFACHYSDKHPSRVDPRDPATAGDVFFEEARSQVVEGARPCLTSVQALAIMSIRELSQGRDSSGYQFAGASIRMALELGLHLSVNNATLSPAEVEVRTVTFWGIFNLETFFSVFVGRLHQLPLAAADIQKPTSRSYSEPNLTSNQVAEETDSIAFLNQLTGLSQLASEMVSDFYAPRERFTTRKLAATYAKYQDWYRNLPDVFRLDNTVLPHVLILHMYYYGCILHLFRPFVKIDITHAQLFPWNTCTFCANQISELTNILRNTHGLRRVSLAVTSFLLSASTIHLLAVPSEKSTAYLNQAMCDFQAMSINHQFAARCIDIIQSLAAKWNIPLPEGVAVQNTSYRGHSPASSSNFWAPQGESFNRVSNVPSQGDQDTTLFQHPPAGQTLPGQLLANDATLHFDPDQAQNAFWTPFPSQAMPSLFQNVNQSMWMVPRELGAQWSVTDRSRSDQYAQFQSE